MKKHRLLSGLFVSLVLLVTNEWLMHNDKAIIAAEPQTGPGGATQTSQAGPQTGGIVIVPTLEKPKNARSTAQ